MMTQDEYDKQFEEAVMGRAEPPLASHLLVAMTQRYLKEEEAKQRFLATRHSESTDQGDQETPR